MHKFILRTLTVLALVVGAAVLTSYFVPFGHHWRQDAPVDAKRGGFRFQYGQIVMAVFDPTATQDQTPRLKDVFSLDLKQGYVLVQEIGPSSGLMPDGAVLKFPAAVRYEASIPGWCFVVTFGAYPFSVVVFRSARAMRRRERGQCVHCGYDLRGSHTGTCPECGANCPGNVTGASE